MPVSPDCYCYTNSPYLRMASAPLIDDRAQTHNYSFTFLLSLITKTQAEPIRKLTPATTIMVD